MSHTIIHTPIQPRQKSTSISIDQVVNLYIGKGKCCRCGCGGKYFYPEKDSGKIMEVIEQMTSGKFEVESIDDEIFEIILDRRGKQKVATLYLKS